MTGKRGVRYPPQTVADCAVVLAKLATALRDKNRLGREELGLLSEELGDIAVLLAACQETPR
jgi:hypothetical protein